MACKKLMSFGVNQPVASLLRQSCRALCCAVQVPFATMVALLCMWMGISFPLVFIGYFFGSRKQVIVLRQLFNADIFETFASQCH